MWDFAIVCRGSVGCLKLFSEKHDMILYELYSFSMESYKFIHASYTLSILCSFAAVSFWKHHLDILIDVRIPGKESKIYKYIYFSIILYSDRDWPITNQNTRPKILEKHCHVIEKISDLENFDVHYSVITLSHKTEKWCCIDAPQ